MDDTQRAEHLTESELQGGLGRIRESPADRGTLELIVCRPAVGERDELEEGELDPTVGLVGDTWAVRSSSRTPDRSAHPDMQLTLMNSRVTALLARSRERWSLAGDQLYVDLDLSVGNLPPGARLAIGDAVVEITAQPHTGCAQFAARFGREALRFVNSPDGKALRLRGANARVVERGTIRRGDAITKLP